MNIVNKDSKNTFTRMCIGEAVIRLLKDTDFDKIRITSVAKCAGVSRITFYKYYQSIHDALCDYLNIIIIEYLEMFVLFLPETLRIHICKTVYEAYHNLYIAK